MHGSLIFASALAAATAGCVFHDDTTTGGRDGTITFDNASTHVLTEVRVAQVHQVDWGPNLLSDVLYPNERLIVSVACDTYDVLVADDRSRECVLADLNLCFSDDVWTIDNATLRNCGF